MNNKTKIAIGTTIAGVPLCVFLVIYGIKTWNRIKAKEQAGYATFPTNTYIPTIGSFGPTQEYTSTPILALTPSTMTPTSTITATLTQQSSLEPYPAPTSVSVEPTLPLPAIATPTPQPSSEIYAAFGDNGTGSNEEKSLRDMIKSYEVDFAVMLGDICYPEYVNCPGNFESVWGDFNPLAPFSHSGILQLPGNHDLDWYFDYFKAPSYYSVVRGPVEFFMLNPYDSGGFAKDSQQAHWLKQTMSNSIADWQVVGLHPAPYSSGTHGSYEPGKWPFKEWGADVVLSAHDHIYERLSIDGIPYFVVGTGGGKDFLYECVSILPESQKCIDDTAGTLISVADTNGMSFGFYNLKRQRLDTITIGNPSIQLPSPNSDPTITPSQTSVPTQTPTTTQQAFDEVMKIYLPFASK